jgi:hypothetical protein
MYRRSLLSLCSVPAVVLAIAPAALAGETTTVTVTEPAPPPPPPVTVTQPAPPPPPPVTVTVPAPPAPPAPSAPRHKSGGDTNSGSGGDTSSPATPVTATPVVARPVAHTVSLESTTARTPVGGVQAGGGGTAPVPGRPDWVGFGLAGGVLLLVGGGSQLLLWARSHRP